MGVLIVCKGADFSKCAVDKVEIPTDPDCTHEYDNDCDTTCNLCGATRTVTHNYVDGVCTICGAKDPHHINSYPVKDGTLKGLYDLSGMQDDAIVDHSGNGNNATVNGAVTFSGDFATFTGATMDNRIVTGVTTSAANTTTIVAMFHVPEGARPIVSNYGNSKGFNFTNKQVYMVAESNGGSKTFDDTTVGASGFAICALTIKADGLRAVKYTNGTFDELVSATLTPKSWTSAFNIGGSPATVNPANDADIALVAIHEGAMTDDQLTDICEFVKTYGEQKGLTIE